MSDQPGPVGGGAPARRSDPTCSRSGVTGCRPPPTAHRIGLTGERAAQIVRQSGSARWVAFIGVTLVALFVIGYYFYDLGFPGVAGSSRLENGRSRTRSSRTSRAATTCSRPTARAATATQGQGGIGPVLNDQMKLLAHLNPQYIRNVLTVGGRYVCGDANSLMPVWAQPVGPLNYQQVNEHHRVAPRPERPHVHRDGPRHRPARADLRLARPQLRPAAVRDAVPNCWKDAFAAPSASTGASAAPSRRAPAPRAAPSGAPAGHGHQDRRAEHRVRRSGHHRPGRSAVPDRVHEQRRRDPAQHRDRRGVADRERRVQGRHRDRRDDRHLRRPGPSGGHVRVPLPGPSEHDGDAHGQVGAVPGTGPAARAIAAEGGDTGRENGAAGARSGGHGGASSRALRPARRERVVLGLDQGAVLVHPDHLPHGLPPGPRPLLHDLPHDRPGPQRRVAGEPLPGLEQGPPVPGPGRRDAPVGAGPDRAVAPAAAHRRRARPVRHQPAVRRRVHQRHGRRRDRLRRADPIGRRQPLAVGRRARRSPSRDGTPRSSSWPGTVYVIGGYDAAGAPTATTFAGTPDPATGAIAEWKTSDDARAARGARLGVGRLRGRRRDPRRRPGSVRRHDERLEVHARREGSARRLEGHGRHAGAARRRAREPPGVAPVHLRWQRRGRPHDHRPSRRRQRGASSAPTASARPARSCRGP